MYPRLPWYQSSFPKFQTVYMNWNKRNIIKHWMHEATRLWLRFWFWRSSWKFGRYRPSSYCSPNSPMEKNYTWRHSFGMSLINMHWPFRHLVLRGQSWLVRGLISTGSSRIIIIPSLFIWQRFFGFGPFIRLGIIRYTRHFTCHLDGTSITSSIIDSTVTYHPRPRMQWKPWNIFWPICFPLFWPCRHGHHFFWFIQNTKFITRIWPLRHPSWACWICGCTHPNWRAPTWARAKRGPDGLCPLKTTWITIASWSAIMHHQPLMWIIYSIPWVALCHHLWGQPPRKDHRNDHVGEINKMDREQYNTKWWIE